MNPAAKYTLIALIPILSIGLSLFALTRTADDVSLADWQTGSNGFQQAVSAQSRTDQPVILFFHTDWCSSCKALTKDVLISAEVTNALRDFIRVKINPEMSAENQRVAQQFGVAGFPTIIVIPASGRPAQRYIPRPGMAPQQFAQVVLRPHF